MSAQKGKTLARLFTVLFFLFLLWPVYQVLMGLTAIYLIKWDFLMPAWLMVQFVAEVFFGIYIIRYQLQKQKETKKVGPFIFIGFIVVFLILFVITLFPWFINEMPKL